MFVSLDSQEAGLVDMKYLVELDIEGTHSKKRQVQLIDKRGQNPTVYYFTMAYWDLQPFA